MYSFLYKIMKTVSKRNSCRVIAKYSTVEQSVSDLLTIGDIREKYREFLGIELGSTVVKEDRAYLLQYLPQTQEEMPARSVKESLQRAIIPLSKDLILQEKYDKLGYVRFGRLMEDTDLFAAWVAINYILNPKQPKGVPSPYNVVTILVDHIKFSGYNPRSIHDIRISGHVSSVGKTSLEITVWLEQYLQDSFQKILTAFFLMAARNADLSGAALINRLEPADAKEQQIVQKGEARKKERLALERHSLMTEIPQKEEQEIIHKLFLETTDTTLSKRVLRPGSMWMADTRLSNLIFTHTEDRNYHGDVFGGFLMRHALELAWFVAYFACQQKIVLRSMSDIIFQRPVSLGAILSLHGHVIYSENNFLQVFVHGDVSSALSGEQVTSLIFNYTYEAEESVKLIKPNTYYEAMMYVKGRREFLKYMNYKNKK